MTNLYKLVLSPQTEAVQSSYFYGKQSGAWDSSVPFCDTLTLLCCCHFVGVYNEQISLS